MDRLNIIKIPIFDDLLYKLEIIKNNFYKNIDYIYNDNRIDSDIKVYIGLKISSFCIEMNKMIGKFRYKLYKDSDNLPIYKRNIKKYAHLKGYNIDDLRKYIDIINSNIRYFNSEIFDLSIYQNNNNISLSKSIISNERQFQLMKNLSTKLENFLNSENSNLILRISDRLYDCRENPNKSLKKILDAYEEKIYVGEKFMSVIRIYILLLNTNNVDIKEIFNLEILINDYIWLVNNSSYY